MAAMWSIRRVISILSNWRAINRSSIKRALGRSFFVDRDYSPLILSSVYFDEDYYKKAAGLGQHADTVRHYLSIGFKIGLSPSPVFEGTDYLNRYADVRVSGINPLLHYILYGAAEGRTPSLRFDRDLFLLHHARLDIRGIDAAAECLKLYGSYEWPVPERLSWRPRPLFDAEWYLASSPDLHLSEGQAYDHYLRIGWLEGRDPNPLFDTDWYLADNPDVARDGMEPLSHYQTYGYLEGRCPNPLFNTTWYYSTYPDVKQEGIDPLLHFMMYGEDENRDPHPRFSTRWYRQSFPESAEYPWGVFAYHFRIGRRKGQPPHAYYSDILVAHPGEDPPTAGTKAVRAAPEQIDPYDSWLEVNTSTEKDGETLRAQLSIFIGETPQISVVMPVYQSDPKLLAAAIESVQAQIYDNWQLCICDDASPDLQVSRIVAAYAERDPRIVWTRSPRNENISGASNRAAALATGAVISLLDHDDLLHPHALAEIALCYAQNPCADIVYSDDDKIDLDGRRYAPQFKPDWSPSLLLAFMYISHLFTFKRTLFESVGGFRFGFEGSQDYDLALRMSERATQVRHIPRILYHWRAAPGSTANSGDAKPDAFESGRHAVQEAIERRGIVADVEQPAFAIKSRLGIFEMQFPDTGPSVTVIIPTRNRVDLLRVAVESLARTTYKNYKLLIIDNESDDPETLAFLQICGARVLRVSSPDEGFSFAHLINAGVNAAQGEYVLLLNNDVEVRTPGWLSQMIGYAQMPGVGAVGARLLYGDGRVQHAGITHGLHEGMAGHSFKLLPSWHHGYLNMALVAREVAAVTGACMLTPRKLFLDLGGLDETNFRVAYNDVDYCYRLVDSGWTCVQCGSAELFHYEGQSRGFGDDPGEERAMRRKYSHRVDPWYNPNLSVADEQFHIGRTHVAQDRKKPIKALFVSHNLNHEGAPNSLFELSTGLQVAGKVEATLITPSDGPLRARYEKESIPTYVVEHPWADSPSFEEFEARLRRMGQAFLYSGTEVVIANTAESFWAIAAARLAGIPSLWIIRESDPWESYFRNYPDYVQNFAYEAFAAPYRVVFVAQATLDAWKPMDSRHSFTLIRNGLNTAELIAAYRGLDRSLGRELVGAEPDDCVFVCIGTVAPRKGQLDLVNAYALLPTALATQARVIIVGDRQSSYSDELHANAQLLPESRRERVVIVGETSEAKTYLVGADVAMCTSRVESYPRVTLEAMAAGLPLITTSVWGIREQVRADYNALLYEPGDVETLARYMTEMILNPNKRQLFASRATAVFESLPSFEFMRDSYASLIRQAVGSR